jgi:hypothetical protein
MSASVAALTQSQKDTRVVKSEAGKALDDKAKLAVAVEALTAIAGENDLTGLRSLFRMRRRAEEALLRIRALRDDQHSLS